METKTENKLPSLVELSGDIEMAFKNDALNLLLNQPPVPKWILKHPFVNVKNAQGQSEPLQYLPIDKVELLLTKIFQEWKAEVMSCTALFNSVAVHVRLHYKNPITGLWSYHDGVGAVGIQTDKGAAASDLSAIKQDAVMKALPAAKSYAIKDAADHLGAIFGRDLNKKDVVTFAGSYANKPIEPNYIELEEELLRVTSKDELNQYWERYPEYHNLTKFKIMFTNYKNKYTK